MQHLFQALGSMKLYYYMMISCIQIFYLLTSTSSLSLRKDNKTDLSPQVRTTISISLLTNETRNKEIDESLTSGLDETTNITTKKQLKKIRKQTRETTPYTTKYERETNKKHGRVKLKELHKNNHVKKHNHNQNGSEYIINIDIDRVAKSSRSNYYVFAFNNTTNEKGVTKQKVILYNRTYCLEYKGNVISEDLEHLCKLRGQLEETKNLNEKFKSPYWTDSHVSPVKVVNYTWDMWNQSGMYRLPSHFIVNADPRKYSLFNMTNWLKQLWSEFKVDNIRINSWKMSDENASIQHKESWKKDQLYGQQPDLSVINSSLSQMTHAITDNKHIKAFTNYILNRSLRFFKNVISKSDEYHARKLIKRLTKLFQDKFQESLSARHQNIKSELDAQKVILNDIDTSNRIVTRLMNVMIADFDERDLLLYSRTPEILKRVLKKEKKRQLNRACSELNICRSGDGIVELVSDVIGIIQNLENDKFQKASDSLFQAASDTNFSETLGENVDKGLRGVFRMVKAEELYKQRTLLIIFKDIIDRRNEQINLPPGVDPASSDVITLLTIIEIIHKLEEKVPNTLDNVTTWNSVRNDTESWATTGTPDISEVMHRLLTNIKSTVKSLDEETRKALTQSFSKMV